MMVKKKFAALMQHIIDIDANISFNLLTLRK